MMSSGSIPVVFQPRPFNGTLYMDGGTAWNTNISTPINRCRDDGFSDDAIIVDVFICGTLAVDQTWTAGHTLHNFMRGRQIRKYYKDISNISTQLAAFPNVQWRYLVQESPRLDGMAELDFTNANTWPFQELGRTMAQDALAYGPGYGFDTYTW